MQNVVHNTSYKMVGQDYQNGQAVEKKKKTPEELIEVFNKYMRKIYVKKSFKHRTFMKFYTYVADFCVAGKELHFWTGATMMDENCCYERYKTNVKTFLNAHICSIAEAMPNSDDNELILSYYCKVWNDFWLSSKVLIGASSYFDKQYHKKNTDHEQIKQILFRIWSDYLFNHLNEKIANAALGLLDRGRSGEWTDGKVIKAVADSYVHLGTLKSTLVNPEENNAHLEVYIYFENGVMEGTKLFYEKESSRAMEKYYHKEKSFVTYLKHVSKLFEDELKYRVVLLHKTTEEKVLKVLSDTLVTKHLEIFDSEFKTALTRDKSDDLSLIYSVAIRSDVVVKRLNQIFGDHVMAIGLNKLASSADEIALKDYKLYIETLLSVYNKYLDMVMVQFKSETGFHAALDMACHTFMNSNVIVDNSKEGTPYSARILAEYCHFLLKKSNKNLDESELEHATNQAMTVFKFIEDKDVFQRYYSKALSKRLIQESSTSDDAEASMISKLKQVCGYEYTVKLQRMFNDIATSKDFNEKFKKRLTSDRDTMDFTTKILSTSAWPINPSITITLPMQLERSYNLFTNFYNTEHCGRKLQLLYSASSGEIVTNCFKNRYIFQVSTFQIAVLLQFNEQTSISFQQLREATEIPENYLKQILQIFTKSKLLLCKDDENSVNDNSMFDLFTEYKNKKLRINLNVPLKVEVKVEREHTQRHIEEDRKIVVQATIVRIMKTRKTLNHQVLISEVLAQVSSRFKVTIPIIKKCIDMLIEKDYLERKDGQNEFYNYVA